MALVVCKYPMVTMLGLGISPQVLTYNVTVLAPFITLHLVKHWFGRFGHVSNISLCLISTEFISFIGRTVYLLVWVGACISKRLILKRMCCFSARYRLIIFTDIGIRAQFIETILLYNTRRYHFCYVLCSLLGFSFLYRSRYVAVLLTIFMSATFFERNGITL